MSDLECLTKNKVNYKSIMGNEDNAILPDLLPEIAYEILVKFPAHNLYQELRLVSKAWQNMISRNNFILDNFARTEPVFLLQYRNAVYKSIHRMEIDEKQLKYKIHESELDCKGYIMSSCYGMALIKSRLPQEVRLRVLNSVTRCCLTLPPCLLHCLHMYCTLALGFDPFVNLFKVVHMYEEGFRVEIFTIGDASNTWKQIPGPCNWNDSSGPRLLSSRWRRSIDDPVSIIINGRFLHWNVLSSEFILSMDVCDEKFIEIQLPNSTGQETRGDAYHLLELGGHLAFTYSTSSTQMDIWILEDWNSKLWLKKHTIDSKMIDYNMPSFGTSKNSLPKLTKLIMLAGTSSIKVLVFGHAKSCRWIYIYETEKKKMKKYVFPANVDKLIAHTSSLFKLQQS